MLCPHLESAVLKGPKALARREGQQGWVRGRGACKKMAHLADRREEDFLHRLSPHVFVQNAECPLPVHGGVGLRRELLRCGGNDTPQLDRTATTGQQVALANSGVEAQVRGGRDESGSFLTDGSPQDDINIFPCTGKAGRSIPYTARSLPYK